MFNSNSTNLLDTMFEYYAFSYHLDLQTQYQYIKTKTLTLKGQYGDTNTKTVAHRNHRLYKGLLFAKSRLKLFKNFFISLDRKSLVSNTTPENIAAILRDCSNLGSKERTVQLYFRIISSSNEKSLLILKDNKI